MIRTLYGKLSIALVAIVLAIAALYAVLTLFATRHHLQVTEQRLNRDLARDLVADRNLVEEGTHQRLGAEGDVPRLHDNQPEYRDLSN